MRKHQRFNLHAHTDVQQAEWFDTARKLWREYRCSSCGRLRRQRV